MAPTPAKSNSDQLDILLREVNSDPFTVKIDIYTLKLIEEKLEQRRKQ